MIDKLQLNDTSVSEATFLSFFFVLGGKGLEPMSGFCC